MGRGRKNAEVEGEYCCIYHEKARYIRYISHLEGFSYFKENPGISNPFSGIYVKSLGYMLKYIYIPSPKGHILYFATVAYIKYVFLYSGICVTVYPQPRNMYIF